MKKNKGHYQKRFRYDVAVNDYGVPGECMSWCEKNCTGAWGWYFESNSKDDDDYSQTWNHENQEAFMSFAHKRDAVRFWFENVKVMSEIKE